MSIENILIWILLASTLGIIIVMLGWNRSMRRKHDQQTARLEEELLRHEEGEKRYQRLIETAPDWIWEVDANGVYTYVSPGVSDLLGYVPEEIIGRTPFDLMPPEEADRVGKIFAEIASEQRPFTHLMNRNIRKDGRIVILETSGTPIFGSEGELLGYHGVDRDISKRKLAEHQLKAEGEFINAVLEVAGNLIVVLDRTGRIVRFNRAAEELTGYSRDEVTGRSVWDVVIPEEQQAAVMNVFENLMNGNTDLAAHYENHWLTRKGEQRLLEWHNTVLHNEKDEISHIVALGYDITEQRAAGVEQERLQRELRQVQKMEALGQLTGGIAHDFNNLLGIIMGFTELAIMKLDGDDQAKLNEYLGHVQTAGVKATNLVSQMLAFSRSETTEDQHLHAAPFLKEDIRTLRSIMPSSIEIVTQIDRELPAIMMNPTELYQLIINLSVNARDAMLGQGQLSIGMRWAKNLETECSACHKSVKGNWIEISVTDTGSGIDPSVLEHIFDPFFTTKDVGKGTGMGLAVVFGIVHNHGGHILVDTQPGRGTTFRMLFEPVFEESSDIIQFPVSSSAPLQGEGEQILVVDDEAELGEVLFDLLTTWGYQPIVMADSQQALDVFKEGPEKFAMLISDQTMPGMTGVELAHQCRKLRHDLPVILCSGYSENIDKNVAEQMGLSYLDKPVQTEYLKAAIKELSV